MHNPLVSITNFPPSWQNIAYGIFSIKSCYLQSHRCCESEFLRANEFCYKSWISSEIMYKGSKDNLRAFPVSAAQAMMVSRLKNILPPMINERERLSWYNATPLSSDTQLEARSIDCASQTGILWWNRLSILKCSLCLWRFRFDPDVTQYRIDSSLKSAYSLEYFQIIYTHETLKNVLFHIVTKFDRQ